MAKVGRFEGYTFHRLWSAIQRGMPLSSARIRYAPRADLRSGVVDYPLGLVMENLTTGTSPIPDFPKIYPTFGPSITEVFLMWRPVKML